MSINSCLTGANSVMSLLRRIQTKRWLAALRIGVFLLPSGAWAGSEERHEVQDAELRHEVQDAGSGQKVQDAELRHEVEDAEERVEVQDAVPAGYLVGRGNVEGKYRGGAESSEHLASIASEALQLGRGHQVDAAEFWELSGNRVDPQRVAYAHRVTGGLHEYAGRADHANLAVCLMKAQEVLATAAEPPLVRRTAMGARR